MKLAPARGVFPRGCKWRAVRDTGEQGRALWAVERYQYFDGALDAWTDEQPAACFVRGQPKMPKCGAVHCTQGLCLFGSNVHSSDAIGQEASGLLTAAARQEAMH